MGHEPAELETRIARCERAVFGDDDSSQGLSARMKVQEMHSAEYREDFKLIKRLVVTAILVGLLNLIINRPASTHAPSQSTSVITGDASDAAAAQLATHRAYLTTADVATLEKVSVREVQDMITSGEITPPPVKQGREYRIATDYRILPHPAADCGTEPQ